MLNIRTFLYGVADRQLTQTILNRSWNRLM